MHVVYLKRLRDITVTKIAQFQKLSTHHNKINQFFQICNNYFQSIFKISIL